MSMGVTVTCTPSTLNEAELAKKIHEAVAGLIQEAGGSPSKTQRTRSIYEYPQAGGGVSLSVGGLQETAQHYIHLDGADIPAPKVVPQAD